MATLAGAERTRSTAKQAVDTSSREVAIRFVDACTHDLGRICLVVGGNPSGQGCTRRSRRLLSTAQPNARLAGPPAPRFALPTYRAIRAGKRPG